MSTDSTVLIVQAIQSLSENVKAVSAKVDSVTAQLSNMKVSGGSQLDINEFQQSESARTPRESVRNINNWSMDALSGDFNKDMYPTGADFVDCTGLMARISEKVKSDTREALATHKSFTAASEQEKAKKVARGCYKFLKDSKLPQDVEVYNELERLHKDYSAKYRAVKGLPEPGSRKSGGSKKTSASAAVEPMVPATTADLANNPHQTALLSQLLETVQNPTA